MQFSHNLKETYDDEVVQGVGDNESTLLALQGNIVTSSFPRINFAKDNI